MVKKLLKYEFLHYAKTMFPFGLITLVIALFSRIIQFFDNGSTAYNIVFYSSVIMYGIAVVMCLVMCFVAAVTRFYKNMFSHEGYLTMTLPATVEQHLFAKCFSAFVTFLSTVLLILVSVCIITFGEVLSEIFKGVVYIYRYFEKDTIFLNEALNLSVFITACFAVIYLLMLLYSCIAIGQLAKKNRILASFGAYFGYYVLTQILGTIFIIIMMTTDLPDLLYNIAKDIGPTYLPFWIMGFISMVAVILSCLFFAICRKIIHGRLNLE